MRVLSGIQPSGVLHFGNYFGAIAQFIERQNAGDELFIFVADWHALTSVRNAKQLRENVHEIVRAYLACGLDPQKVTLYRQSDVPEIQELSWILSCLAPMGLLERAHSYKDKISNGLEASVGLFTYPVLMAADILIVGADKVPVGKDQKQHVEIARDLAQKFNSNYTEIFKLPEPEIKTEVATVVGLDGQKMSKSYGNTIPLFAEPKELEKLCKKIKTDSKLPEEPKNPEEVIPYQLLKLVNPKLAKTLEPKLKKGGMGYGDLKKMLAEELVKFTEPMLQSHAQWLKKPQEIEKILEKGAQKARAEARGILDKVREAVGLV